MYRRDREREMSIYRAKQAFGNLKESKYASDYSKFKRLNQCKVKTNYDSAALYSNLYTKQNLEGVDTIKSIDNPTSIPINPCLPFYAQFIIDPSGQLFGNTACGVNGYLKYNEKIRVLPNICPKNC